MPNDLRTGQELLGQKGKYAVKTQIGSGGNGLVYKVYAVCSFDKDIREGKAYALKYYRYEPDDERYKKRRERFKQEIDSVRKLQDKITGILPILDLPGNTDGELWYIMPLARRIDFTAWDITIKLKFALDLGKIVADIHKHGCMHRDIKPGNVIFWEDRLHLADFGLVRDLNDIKKNLTEPEEIIGPLFYRPPEMMHVTDRKMDYRPADVYMFAKTVWSMIKNSAYGFDGEYRRDEPEIYLNPEDAGVATFEPLHRLLEGATRYDRSKRITIEDAICLLQQQRDIAANRFGMDKTAAYQTQEKLTQAVLKCRPNSTEYFGSENILQILNAIRGTAQLSVAEFGVVTELGVFVNIYPAEESLYVMEIEYGYRSERKLGFCFESVVLKEDRSKVLIHTMPLKTALVTRAFKRIDDALMVTDDVAFIDGRFDVTLTLLPS